MDKLNFKGGQLKECIINDLPIYYEIYGQGKPVLCLHGFFLDHKTMTGCLEPIFKQKDGYRRIYPDLPGMGKTPARAWIENADDMLHLLKGFINRVIHNESFLLIGESYGGYLSLGFMLDSKINIDGIFLICPCTVAKHEKRKLPQKTTAIEEKNLKKIIKSSDDYRNFMENAVVATKETWERYKIEVLDGMKIGDKKFLENYQENGYSYSFASELNKLTYNKPICVLTGKQDNSVGYEDAWEMLKDLPLLSYTVLNGAGHNLQIEKSALFNSYLEEWLKQVKNEV